jgi:hypothetical protein
MEYTYTKNPGSIGAYRDFYDSSVYQKFKGTDECEKKVIYLTVYMGDLRLKTAGSTF